VDTGTVLSNWTSMVGTYGGLFGGVAVVMVGFAGVELVVRTFVYGLRKG
jgi:hypothetical protein